jgi:hypothetical protein
MSRPFDKAWRRSIDATEDGNLHEHEVSLAILGSMRPRHFDPTSTLGKRTSPHKLP